MYAMFSNVETKELPQHTRIRKPYNLVFPCQARVGEHLAGGFVALYDLHIYIYIYIYYVRYIDVHRFP